MADEIWKPVRNYEGLYEVSNMGRVKSISHKSWNGKGYFLTKPKIIKPRIKRFGYLSVALSKNNKAKEFKVHRLVAIAFIPNPQNLPQVNHKDENKLNNRVSNLEWCTPKYNNNYGEHTKNISQSLLKNHRLRPVLQLNNGKVIRRWKSINELKNTRFKTSYIYSTMAGRYSTAYGYSWKYEVN
ncbi:NUMOD4 domain-containing protein [Limosilactobacillus vaginalis]|uniref:NUMOD4 domain-containing protein n=1 Tax=Limosilactobacillus vaginalis TaxID=1633 RepID=UPI00235A42D8|nr:NUMOD4 domain-containing protein [Limosilactobacillus vaginalis]WCT58847.1 NUMOD4 domain-containing protein [Limosilactobacillus vaginalis]